MDSKVWATIDDAEFQKLVLRVIEKAKKEPSKVVGNMAKDYAREAWRTTRVAGPMKFLKKTDSGGDIYWVPLRVPRRYPAAGFARASWIKVMIGAGVKSNSAGASKRLARAARFGVFQKTQGPMKCNILLGDDLYYIGDLDAKDGINATAMGVVVRNMSKYMGYFGRDL